MSARRNAALAAILIVTTLLVGGGAFLAGWRLRSAERREVETHTVITKIRRIAKLATIESHEAQIVKVEEGTPVFYLFESKKNAILLVKGKVVAGVDLNAARIEVQEDAAGRTLYIELPPSEIIAIDPTVQFYQEQSGWLNPITSADRNEWLQMARVELAKAAREGGILQKADSEVRTLVTALADGLGYRVVIAGAGVPIPKDPS